MGNLVEGLVVTFIGMAAVFSVLLLISLSISVFKLIFINKEPAAKKIDGLPAPIVLPAPAESEQPKGDDLEIIAAITAAIAASLSKSTDELVVRSYHRVPLIRK